MEDRPPALPPNRSHRRLQDLSLTFPPPPLPQVQPAARDNFSYNFTHFQNGLNLNETTTFPEGPNPRIITSDDDVWKDISPQPSDFYPHLGMAVNPPVQMSQWMQISSSTTTATSFDFPAQHHVLMKPPVVMDNGNNHHCGNDHGEVSENNYVVDEHVERRQMRMIKNRESAARSRARKQAYTNQLEQKVIWLRKTVSWLKKQKEVCQLLFSNPKAAEKRYQLRRTSSANF